MNERRSQSAPKVDPAPVAGAVEALIAEIRDLQSRTCFAHEASEQTRTLFDRIIAALHPQPAPAVAVEADDQPRYMTWNLHPRTADLVHRFSYALAGKLAAAEKKYGYSDGWADPDWMDECREKLTEHVAKGDPRDVAAYCAFLWHHGASTAPSGPSMKTIADLTGVFDEGVRQGAALAAGSAPAVAEKVPLTEPVTVTVEEMVESVNGVSWWVVLRRGKHRQDDGKYGADYKNRAEWHAAGLRWILGQGEKPNIRDFMDAPPTVGSGFAQEGQANG